MLLNNTAYGHTVTKYMAYGLKLVHVYRDGAYSDGRQTVTDDLINEYEQDTKVTAGEKVQLHSQI